MLIVPFILSSIYYLPFIFAITCWLCVSILLYLLIRPKHSINFLGIKMQGWLYAQQLNIEEALAKNIVMQLITQKEKINASITSEENIEKLMPLIEKHIQEFLTIKVPQQLPMIAMFLGEKTTTQIKEVFIAELRTLFPQVLSQYFTELFDEQKLNSIVFTQLSLSAKTLINTLVEESIRRSFLKIKLYAFATGLIIGCVLILILHLFA